MRKNNANWKAVRCRFMACWVVAICGISGPVASRGETPSAAYIFPAGAQRGAAVDVRIGGHFFHDRADFLIHGPGADATSPITRVETLWFEGPLLPLPASQQKEDYPKDYSGRITVAPDASLGTRRWNGVTSQGIASSLKFVIGNLPEVIEDEVSGKAAEVVSLPVTINGRIFPREDVDDWLFEARAGQVITCEVNAARLGSGLDSRLEIRDPDGRVVAENSDTFGADSFVRFTVASDGQYRARIHDIRFDGLQHFVYRLTISAGPWVDAVFPLGGQRGAKTNVRLIGANLAADQVEYSIPNEADVAGPRVVRGSAITGDTSPLVNHAVFETDELPELIEAERTDGPPTGQAVLPCVLNGVIAQPSELDSWVFSGKKGDVWQFDLRASRLGSELDGVLTLLDAKGNTISTADDLANGQTDAVLTATLPADGDFTLKVADRISSRGGPRFAYRVRISDPRTAPLRLTTPNDTISLARGGEVRVKVLAERPQGFADEVTLDINGLPDGVTATGKLGKGQNQVDLVLKADASAKLATSRLRIIGKWKIGDAERSAVAEVSQTLGEPRVEELLLRVGLATPFKLKGVFETKYVARGSVFTRQFHIERNGFAGPMWAELADRQARHLQGVTGPRIAIPADSTEFEYPFTLAPWMEIGRTSRTCVAVFGEIEEPDGTKHVVSHTSQNQDDQAIVLVEPNRMSLESSVGSIRWTAGREVRVPVRVSRSAGLRGVVRIDARLPRGVAGMQIDSVEIPATETTGEVVVRFTAEATSPKEAQRGPERLTLKASMLDERGFPLTDEISIDVVAGE